MNNWWLLYHVAAPPPPPGPAQVLAVLTPGDSRSQTTDPLTQSDTGTPGTVAGPYADDAWEFDGSERVAFTEVAAEIGADNERGALAFWYTRPTANGTSPDLVKLGDGTTPGAFIYPRFRTSDGRFIVEFYDDAGNYLTDVAQFVPVAPGGSAFVYVDWDGPDVRIRVDGNAPTTGNRGAVAPGGFGGDSVVVAAAAGASSRAAILGPAMLADGPLEDADVDCLYARTTAWALDMGTAGWCDPVPVDLAATLTVETEIAAALTVAKPLQAALPVPVGIDAALTVAKPLAALLDVPAAITADLTVAKPVAATVEVPVAIGAALAVAKPLAAVLSVPVEVDAALGVAKPLQATVTVEADIAAGLTVAKPLAALVVVETEIGAALGVAKPLAAALTVPVVIAADLTVAAPIPPPTRAFVARSRATDFTAAVRTADYIARTRQTAFVAGEDT